MKGRFLLPLVFILFSFSACTEKQEEVELEKVKEEKATEAEATPPQIGPHTGVEIKKWVGDLEKTADPGLLMKLDPFTKKFTAGELIAGIATRPVKSHWNNLTEEQQLKTLAIMNTNFSKIRIEAGLIEIVKPEGENILNSTLYLEDETGNLVAVSDATQGNHILMKTGNQPG